MDILGSNPDTGEDFSKKKLNLNVLDNDVDVSPFDEGYKTCPLISFHSLS